MKIVLLILGMVSLILIWLTVIGALLGYNVRYQLVMLGLTCSIWILNATIRATAGKD